MRTLVSLSGRLPKQTIKMKQPERDDFFVFAATSMLANRLQVVGSRITGSITFKQWLVLLVVRDMPTGSSITEIAATHGSSRQNVKKLLDGLARMDFLIVEDDPTDKRANAVRLTAKGVDEMQRISGVGAEFVSNLFDGTKAADVAATRRVMLRLLCNLDTIAKEEVLL